MKRSYLSAIVAFAFLWIISMESNMYAQISEGGTPASFAIQENTMVRTAKKVPYTAQVNFNITQLRAEDQAAEENNTPPRVGIIIPADLNTDNAGEWTTLPDGQHIWRLTVKAPGATATMLYYDRFYIPDGGKLFIYNADHTHLLGAYTSRTNPDDKIFATEFIAGDEIILEYNAPGSQENETTPLPQDMPHIQITGIGYGYNYLEILKAGNQLNEVDLSCMVNVNCPEGANWQNQKKGVVATIIPIGTGMFNCSGTIVNNTTEDLTPFFLTASHCFYDGNIKCTKWNQIIYSFNAEKAGCSNMALSLNLKTIVGAQLLVELPTNGSSDGALLKLNGSIPADYNVYYNGWDRRNAAASSGVGIHHPDGDYKKISTFTTNVTSATYPSGATNAHWSVNWTETESGFGVTEGGSSGSPLFNQDRLVTGTLSGGKSSCRNPYNSDLYGKLWYHWDNASIAGTKKMKDYLDPLNSGVETLKGTYTAGGSGILLKSLSVNPGAISPAFSSSVTSYSVIVPNEVSSITISTDAANTESTVMGSGTHALQVGSNTIPVVITAKGGASRTYTITVRRSGDRGKNDVYVSNSTGYCKNEMPVTLSKASGTYIWTIAMEGDEVYAAGYVRGKNNLSNAACFHGCTATTLSDKESEARAIVVSAGNIYVAGYVKNGSKNVATYWENGTMVSLTDGTLNAYTLSIAVADGDVYVAGYEHNGTNNVAKYWKNDMEVPLTNGMQNAIAYSITVVNHDVYVAGYEYNGSKYVAKYWKNGTEVPLTDGTQNNYARSIVVAGNDVYVAGCEYIDSKYIAKYWKNGVEVPLSNGEAYSIAIVGSDVYVSGDLKYWVNSTEVFLPRGTPYQIIVVPGGSGNNANLSSLSIDPTARISPDLDPCSTTRHIAYVPNSAVNITISATPEDAKATVTGTGVHSLHVGSNNIPIVVTAPDGKTVKTYTLTVIRSDNQGNDDVYVAGDDGSDAPQYWKNGISVPLDYVKESNRVTSVAISGNDVYAAGYVSNNNEFSPVPVYWKNGVPIWHYSLVNYTASAIHVEGNDVYVAGGSTGKNNIYNVMYWKNNGTEHFLYSSGSNGAGASAITVSGGNVYVTGYEYNSVSKQDIPRCWKNNGSMTLGGSTSGGRAMSVAVSNGDVYVAGYRAGDKKIALYWKNGTAVLLTDGKYNAEANSIFVAGDDVYVAGRELDENGILVAKYWKNGVAVLLTDGSMNAWANSIVVKGNDVYVAGRDGNYALYWKNGMAVALNNGINIANAYQIAVTPSTISANNADLTSLRVNPGTLTPIFSAGTTAYTVNVANSVSSISVSATASDTRATVTGTGARELNVGTNTIPVTVKARDGKTTKTYTITVVRAAASGNSNADLQSLSINPGTLTPAFNANTTSYTVNVADNISSITVSATPADGNAKVTGTGARTLNVGSNTIPVTVTAENGVATKTYTIVVTRQSETASNNAALGAVSVNSLTASLKAGSTTTYEITVESTTSVTIAATSAHSAATISSSDLGAKPVQPGLNIFTIGVTAEDGTTTVNYRLEVTVKEVVSGVGDMENNPLKVYPNPARDHITISGLQGNGILTLFDPSGKQHHRHNISAVEEKLFVGDLLPGNYIVHVKEGKKVRTIKIVIE